MTTSNEYREALQKITAACERVIGFWDPDSLKDQEYDHELRMERVHSEDELCELTKSAKRLLARPESVEPAAAEKAREPSPRITREEAGHLIREFGLSLVAQLRNPSEENHDRGSKATRALLEALTSPPAATGE